MRRIYWVLLWLSATAGLAGCYGNMNPGSTASANTTLPSDTASYAPTNLPPLTYHSQLHLLDKAFEPRPSVRDTNVISRVWTLDMGTLRRPAARRRTDAPGRTAVSRIQAAPDSELPAVPSVRTLPAAPPAVSKVAEATSAQTLPSPVLPMLTEVEMRVQRDGDVKYKDAVGNKLKVDADDGTIKQKPVGGAKSKIK